MAYATPQLPSAMRAVRDNYLSLLLSAQAQTPAPFPQQPPQPPPQTWTPGKTFHPSWTSTTPAPPPPPTFSPVTPTPTETDVRLAELAAGLVAAGGVEARQTDTIRRLADELQHSQERLRSLEKSASPKKHTPRSSKHPSSEKKRRSPRQEETPRRTIRFTPSTERRANERSPRDSENVRRTARERTVEIRDVRKIQAELASLRRERAEWVKERERARGESESLAKMLMDIKANTRRLLDEREMHLNVIAKLRAEKEKAERGRKEDCRPAESPIQNQNQSPSRMRSPTREPSPAFSRRAAMEAFAREPSPSSVRNLQFEEMPHEDAGVFREGLEEDDDDDDDDFDLQQDREEELRCELRIVLAENEKMSQRIPALEAECLNLSRRLRKAEADVEANLFAGGDVTHPPVGRRRTGTVRERKREKERLGDGLMCLVEEVEILEGVSEAINFGITPSEAEELEDSLTHYTVVSGEDSGKRERERDFSEAAVVQDVVKRLVHIRSGLSLRYGQWLKAVGEDESCWSGLEVRLRNGNDTVATINTQIVDRLIADD